MTKEKIIELFIKNNGWLSSSSFGYKTHIYRHLKKMIQDVEVEQVRKGLFHYKKLNQSIEGFEEIAAIYPAGVICLFSAWQYHQLSTTVPYQHHIAFPHKAKPIKTENSPIKFYYWGENQYKLGLTKKENFSIYDIEKSVCDAVKFRNKVGEEITLEVIQNYMKRSDRRLEKLMQYAKFMRIEKTISPLLKTLI